MSYPYLISTLLLFLLVAVRSTLLFSMMGCYLLFKGNVYVKIASLCLLNIMLFGFKNLFGNILFLIMFTYCFIDNMLIMNILNDIMEKLNINDKIKLIKSHPRYKTFNDNLSLFCNAPEWQQFNDSIKLMVDYFIGHIKSLSNYFLNNIKSTNMFKKVNNIVCDNVFKNNNDFTNIDSILCNLSEKDKEEYNKLLKIMETYDNNFEKSDDYKNFLKLMETSNDSDSESEDYIEMLKSLNLSLD